MNGRGRRTCTKEPQSRYEIVRNVPGRAMVIRDVGHAHTRSVTNDTERVVREIFEAGLLHDGRRLFYQTIRRSAPPIAGFFGLGGGEVSGRMGFKN